MTIGSSVISLLGLVFGCSLIVAGSELTWRSDRVLGLFSRSGWRFGVITGGDGRITMALGVLMAIGFILGALLKSAPAYGISLAADLLVMALCVYELIYLFSRHGIVGPGNGLFMVLGGSVAGGLCALGGYLMMSEELTGASRRKRLRRAKGESA